MNFQEMIAAAKREAKGEATEAEIDELNRPDLLPQWVQALRAAIDDATEQFTLQKERLDRIRSDTAAGLGREQDYHAAVDAYEMWAKKANRYRLGLQQRLAEITANVETDADKLRSAIADHRRATLRAGEPTAADLDLWSYSSTDKG